MQLTAQETAFDRLIDALEKAGSTVKQRGDGTAVAQCVAHGDNTPSLSLRRIEGTALVNCFSGCDIDAVLDAIGLTKADLFDNRHDARYAYTDMSGNITRTVIRDAKKKFTQTGNTKGKPELFRLSNVVQAVAQGKEVWLCEGEKDCLTLESCGVVATSAPMGANNVSKVDASPLRGAKVIAVVDKDEPGQKWAADVAELLDGVAKSVRFVEAKQGKDASDHVMNGHGLNEFIPKRSASDELLATLKTGDWLDAQTFPALAWAVHGLIPEGFGLFTGPPKAGKSWATLGIALAVASGNNALGRIPTGEPRPVLLLALEDGDRRLQGRCRALLDEGEPIPEMLDYSTDAKPHEVFPLVQAWLRKHGHERPLVILDTLGRVMPAALPGEGAYQRDYRVGAELKGLVDAHPGACLLVVHHVRKQAANDWMDSTSGTNGLNGAADWTINLERPRNESGGILRVTGRDVVENEYAVTQDAGRWTIDGHELAEAARKAAERQITGGLADTSTALIEYLGAQPEPVKAKDVEEALDMPEARTYLARLAKAGRIQKVGRGLYTTVAMSQVLQVSQSEDAPPAKQAPTHGECSECHQPMLIIKEGQGKHPTC